MARIVRTNRLQVSDVAVSTLSGQPVTSIGIPVTIAGDAGRYVLAMVLPALDTSPIFHRSDLPSSWFSGVIDRSGNYVAGHRSAEHADNLPVISRALLDAAAEGDGVIEGVTERGDRIDVAYSGSTKTGWISLVAMPRAASIALRRRAEAIAAMAGGLLVLVTFGIALLVEPRVIQPMRDRLIEDEERFREMANTVPGILFTSDPAGRCDYVSDAFYAFTGLPPGSALGHGWMAALHPDDRQTIADLLDDLACAPGTVSSVAPAEREIRFRARDGSYRWFLSRSRTLRDAQGRPTRRFGTATDIDDLKRIEAALRDSQQEIRRTTGLLIQAQDAERRRIAHDIHDTTVQDLFGVELQLSRLRKGKRAPDVERTLEEMHGLIRKAYQDLRTASYLMHPATMNLLGLAGAIRDFAQGFEARSGLRVTVEIPRALSRLPEAVEITLFRVVQEGLTNVYRHAGSPDASVTLRQDGATIALEIADHGRGMDPAAGPAGVGISGIRLRLEQIGGALELHSDGGRTTLRATVPLSADA